MARVVPLKSIAEAAPLEEAAPAAAAARPFLGDVLVSSGRVARDKVEAALVAQRGQDTLLGHILLVEGHLCAEDLVDALSEQSGLGRIDLDLNPPDATLLDGLDPYVCLRLEALPWRTIGGRRVIAISNPANGPEALRILGAGSPHLALAIAPPAAIRRAISQRFGARMRDDAQRRCPPRFSCRSLLDDRLTWRKSLLIAGTAGALALAPILMLQIALGWIIIANLATTGLRGVAIFARCRAGQRPPTEATPPRLVDLKRLPRVSVLVPLWREEKVAAQLIDALAAMEYPAPLLDIKLVLEECDETTRAAIARATLPPTIEIINVPADRDGLRTKPRAMNYALPFCKGEIVGVYDAEDRPHPGQIRAVVQHLEDADDKVACVQGYLDFYNTSENWLSRCFTIEYAIWFRVILHGVQKLGIPIPLGGTTVFFRRRALEEIGAWDAHNVTEDADLGMRLARFGYRCEMIPTTTEEEANCRSMGRWIRQRSRWLKGYAITWATHMRDPVALWRDLGPRGFLGFQVLFLGAMTSYLALPVFWLLWTAALGFDMTFWDHLAPGAMAAFFFTTGVGQVVMLTCAWIALVDSGRGRMLPWIFTLPVYWPLGAAAAWRALAEIFYAPFHWHKTDHGHAEDADGTEGAA